MFTNLLASARELRFPLTIGYATLLTVWILLGEQLAAAARADELGQRLLSALDSAGPVAVIGFITFVAAMVGSVLWHGGVQRLVRFIAAKSDHPNWEQLIQDARRAAREYGEYTVLTYKGASNGKLSPFDQRHSVPSTAWATHLTERVQERERKAAEMSFRVTLAVALIPVAVALGIEGMGLWWLSLLAIPVIWLDVAFLKYTTLRTVYRFRAEDLEEDLTAREASLITAEAQVMKAIGTPTEEKVRKQRDAVSQEVDQLRADLAEVHRKMNRRASKFFAFLEGKPAAR